MEYILVVNHVRITLPMKIMINITVFAEGLAFHRRLHATKQTVNEKKVSLFLCWSSKNTKRLTVL